jgi:hypothetical protein
VSRWRHDRHERCPHEELAAAAALHALEPAEEALLAEHLPECGRCRIAIAGGDEAMARLAGAIPQETPPRELRSRILALAAQTPQEPELAGTSDAGGRSTEAQQSRLAARRHTRRRARRTLTSVAAGVVVAALVVLGVRVGQLTAARNEAVAASTQAQQKLTSTTQRLQAFENPAARKVVLRNGADEPVAILSQRQHEALLMPTGLKPTPANMTYVLWGVDSKTPVALGTFRVHRGGSEVAKVTLPPAAGHDAAFAVSLEHGHQAPPQPTHPIAHGTAAA